jgi:hypothetical protein
MEDDPIVMRLPVYVRPADPARPMCVFQFPLRPRWRPYRLDDLKAAKCRPKQRRVELTLGDQAMPPLDPSATEVADAPLKHTQLASTTAAVKTSYAIGMLHTDPESGTPQALCLTPLDAAVQLRPSFAEIDRAAAAAAKADAAGGSRAAGGMDDDDGADGSGMRADGFGGPGGDDEDDDALDDDGVDDEMGDSVAPTISIAPQFRPAQTEREIEARRSSHAFLVEQREAEPWSQATLHPPGSEAAQAVRAKCFERPQ